MDSPTNVHPKRSESFVEQHSPAVGSFALDEAFAELPTLNMRVDQPKAKHNAPAKQSSEDELMSEIGMQLRAIELQRARLVQLLNDFGSQ